MPRRGAETVPTQRHDLGMAAWRAAIWALVRLSCRRGRQARAFHWPLEFPDVMQRGGFDVVRGNPPWERIKFQEKEFFASRKPEIAECSWSARAEEGNR